MQFSNPAMRPLRTGGELVVASSLERATADERATAEDFNHDNNVIFIHGFTSHGKYMQTLMRYFDNNGFRAFMFNYDSYRGIRKSADVLFELLTGLNQLGNGIVKKQRVSLVCHSMGGLVARAFTYIPKASDFLYKIVTLGTPHSGILTGPGLLKAVIKWGEHISNANPGFNRSCQSAKALIGADGQADGLLAFIKRPNPSASSIPILSISGGKPWLEFSKNPLANRAMNRRVQKIFGVQNNDGLVGELSADIRKTDCIGTATHFNSYSEYPQINHTYLIENNLLSLKIMHWIMTGLLANS